MIVFVMVERGAAFPARGRKCIPDGRGGGGLHSPAGRRGCIPDSRSRGYIYQKEGSHAFQMEERGAFAGRKERLHSGRKEGRGGDLSKHIFANTILQISITAKRKL
jgi:hypothetical protein